MKKILALFTCLLLLCACSGHDLINLDTRREHITAIRISTTPEDPELERVYTSPEKIDALSEYLEFLDLSDDYKGYDPDDYVGMTWLITVQYDDQDDVVHRHIGDLMFKTDDGPWYKMDREQAMMLATIVEETPSD